MEKNLEITNKSASNGFGIASMVLGIVSILAAVFLGGVLGILAVIFGIVGLKKGAGKGFAIAGIVTGAIGIVVMGIYLTVLLSLPALQISSQADTQRKNDASRFISAVVSYQADNSGQLPSEDSVNSFVNDNLTSGGAFADPSGVSYNFVNGRPAKLGEVYYKTGVVCNDSGTDFVTGTAVQAAVIFKLSSGFYCANT